MSRPGPHVVVLETALRPTAPVVRPAHRRPPPDGSPLAPGRQKLPPGGYGEPRGRHRRCPCGRSWERARRRAGNRGGAAHGPGATGVGRGILRAADHSGARRWTPPAGTGVRGGRRSSRRACRQGRGTPRGPRTQGRRLHRPPRSRRPALVPRAGPGRALRADPRPDARRPPLGPVGHLAGRPVARGYGRAARHGDPHPRGGPVRASGPVVRGVPARRRHLPQLLRGNAGSALAGAVRELVAFARAHDRPDVAARARALAAELFDDEALRRTGAPHGPAFRRRSCCLYWRCPGGGLCGDCVFDRAPGQGAKGR